MKRSVLGAGLLAALCALPASSALAQFSNVEQSPWQGGTFHYYGITKVTSGTLNNSGALIYDTSTLPATTGPLTGSGGTQAGDYYIGVGVLVDGTDGTTVNNNASGTMQAIVTGSGAAYAAGIWSIQLVNINNWGTCNGQVLNYDGAAFGVYADSSGANITNNAGATMSATAQWLAQGIQAGQTVNVVNNGTIEATATGGRQGTTANQTSVSGVGLFSYSTDGGAPLYLENNGSISANAPSDSDTNNGAGCSVWGEGSSVMIVNNGTVSSINASSQGDINGIYFGADHGDVTFVNTGTLTKVGPGTWGVELENDSPGGNMYFSNSGTIIADPGYAVGINNYSGGPFNACYVTNTGTITGNPDALELLWGGDTTVVDSGDLRGWFWLGGGNNTVYINGLPTIDNTISSGSGSNTLVFNLTGTLQSVNGNSASGTNLSAFNLGALGSGSIVVSGKTYSWSNFTNVFGAIIRGTTPLAGPTNLTATVASSSQANLSWRAVTNAASYNVKRSLISDGPYTTIASGVATTNYTDTAAFVGVEYYYVVSAMVGGSETANSAEVALRHPKLTGAIIGTPGSWGNSGNTITNVFDNNLNTFFDGPTGNGCWVGLYFGASVSNAITQINYCPRSGSESRMVPGIFQGANQANFSDAVTLATVTTQPPTGVFTTVSLTNTAAFRYVRYLSPNGGYGNVAELQFYGYLAGASVPLPQAPGGLAAAAVSSSQINLTWNVVTNAAGYNVKRSTTNGGPYVIIATGVTATNYNDTGLADVTTYFYVVSGVNAGGESTNSAQVSATTMLAAPEGLTATAVSATQISLTWNAVTDATSYNVKRSTTSGGPYTTIATGATSTNYADTDLVVGDQYYYVVSAVSNGMESLNSSEATSALPYPWLSQDIGAVGIAGSATYSNGLFSVTGSGADIWNPSDAFRFVYVPVTGNCTIVARVTALQNVDSWSKAGVMLRASLASNAANAFIAVTPGNGVTWQYRSSDGGGCNNNTTSGNAPYWVKLVCSGNTFTGYCSPHGSNWTQLGSTTLTNVSTAYIGLALTSHKNSSLCAATFDNVTAPNWLTPAPPAAPAGLTATVVGSQVALSWAASSGAISYNVKRATVSGGPYASVTNVTTTNYTDIGLVNGMTYYYVVSALNTAGESANSAPASATTPALPPPHIVQASIAGGDVVFSGTNGLPGGTYEVLSSTNMAMPLGNWTQVSGGNFDGNGNFSVSNAINAGEPQRFYLLRQP